MKVEFRRLQNGLTFDCRVQQAALTVTMTDFDGYLIRPVQYTHSRLLCQQCNVVRTKNKPNAVPFHINKLNERVIALVRNQTKSGIDQCLMDLSTWQHLVHLI